MKRIQHIYLGLFVWLLILSTMGCTDELAGNTVAPGSLNNLHLLVPTVLSANGDDQTDITSGMTTYNATVDECQINDLRLYAFPVDGNGSFVSQPLTAPLASMMLDEHIATYQLSIQPGKYHIYVVANMNDVLKNQDIETEDRLKEVVLNYTTTSQSGLPISTNIPMLYEPKDINGNEVVTEIAATGDKYTEVAANLKFTCVKVKLNLIFDPAEGSSLYGKTLNIKDIIAQQLSPKTDLVWDGKFSKASRELTSDYATGITSTLYNSGTEANAQGGYYQQGAWTEDENNKNANDKDVVTLGEGAVATASPVSSNAPWLFQGTYYLPERYVAEAAQQSNLKIEGSVNGIDNNYLIKLGHVRTAGDVPTFPRGTYYEITGKFKTFGNMNLDCQVSVKDWEPVQIDADFNHTTLWVSKTEASVSSTQKDSIGVTSNASVVEFGCDKKITYNGNENDVIIEMARNQYGDIVFGVNPNIPISAYPESERKGKARVWIKANNLKKYVTVSYDVSPFFDVTPQDIVIYYEDGAVTNKKTVEWSTNLGGISLADGSDLYTLDKTFGNSTIKVNINSSEAGNATGTFTIEATTNPITTTTHELMVYPKNRTTHVGGKTIRVTVKPPVKAYRIYFRAINDLAKDTRVLDNTGSHANSHTSTQFEKIKEEYTGTGSNNNNWYDGWDAATQSGLTTNTTFNNNPSVYNHNVYIYTQLGETTGINVDSKKVWKFTEWRKTSATNDQFSPVMTADENNPGWYYHDLGVSQQSSASEYDQKTRSPKPGETLLIFHNDQYPSDALHRCPQHLEPGIPLFDFEDREGWILYDPTSDPAYRIYDNKPTVKDVEFTVWTKQQITGWYTVFGVADDKGLGAQHTLWDNVKGNDGNTFWSYKPTGSEWYLTQIHLKAADGNHSKSIILKYNDNGEKHTLLFGGKSYERYGDTGYYENGAWHAGTPTGAKK